ncbi:MAG TPA: 2-succinyl-5-enolpyruvyl-6-hydroxy-3-cyclohexene-1-carboxylic-acid synthase [Solirubrobacteraceae bacterium]|jgi:2-succinyl-5-enolpyruvyl-6-hydroxy-3-cyclohexene-1-carboxylate synthase|nr:2-succinyl-5-enolpyruvyl-6-hydroxy-3-cyclohexene-1-carboxylic-acid synthase [Solirubrobacteraceae bacterium]
MPAGPDTHLLLRAFVDELARCGVREACTSPGSRCSPIVLALVRDGRLRCHSHIDERCAGFFAVGAAKASGLPVAITCTSGTAAANLVPAVVEAWEARVPLVVLTADRPPELREVGAGQSIDQIKLYGNAAKWFFEVGTHDATPERLRWMRMLACRAVWTALDGRPGPVHLNLPLREPLVPPAELGPDRLPGRGGGRPWLLRSTPGEDAGAAGRALAVVARDAHRPLVVAGRAEPGLEAIAPACERLGWPLLADPLSGARRGGAAVAHYDLLLRSASFAAAQQPDLVIRCGDLPTSKPLRAWLDGIDAGVTQLGFDPHSCWHDPSGSLQAVLAADAAATLAATATHAPRADPTWLAAWRDADARAAIAIDGVLGDELSEPRVARELGARLPACATLFVASSMPVRDVETYTAVRDDPPRVLCNRGANGIDGTVSSAFGAAAVSAGPVVLLIGDVALAHDVGGLLAARRLGLSLTIVLIDNDGGGIFEFLPVAGARDAFEEHVATPHGLDFAHAAALYGCAHERVETVAALRAALERALPRAGTTIVELRTERAANLALHRALVAAATPPG